MLDLAFSFFFLGGGGGGGGEPHYIKELQRIDLNICEYLTNPKVLYCWNTLIIHYFPFV